MTTEALRLRTAVEASSVAGDRTLPPGATPAELAALRAAFADGHLPHELVELLAVINGTGTLPMWNGDVLLDCAGIVRETASRRDGAAIPWCSAWTVISSEGWHFSTVQRCVHPVGSSPVIDHDNGNQYLVVTGATLTSLVAAAADVWERGAFDDPADVCAGWTREANGLIEWAEQRYPGESGLRSGDTVAHQPTAWPRDWPDRVAEPDLLPGAPVLLADLTRRPHAITVHVNGRDGRAIQVADASGTAWLDLPPAFDPDDTVAPGVIRTFVVTDVIGAPTRIDPRVTLRIQGVLDEG